MTPLFATTLVAHVALGLIGLALIHLAFMQIIRREPPYHIVVRALFYGAITLFLSWGSGAYYYVLHYGTEVKPRILEGAYPWVHAVIMESKEHVFLLIPLLVLAAWFSARALRLPAQAGEAPEPTLKIATAVVIGVALSIGVFVAAAGIIISGAVR